MALIKCYDTKGVEHMREAVDARECVREMGWTLEPKIIELEKVVVKLTAAEKKAAADLEAAQKKLDDENRLKEEAAALEKKALEDAQAEEAKRLEEIKIAQEKSIVILKNKGN